MAATGTPTPNIGLRIPLGTDPASVDDINYNSNLLDTKLGAVGSDSVQDQIDALNSKSTWKLHNTYTIDNLGDTNVTNLPNDAVEYALRVGKSASVLILPNILSVLDGGWIPIGYYSGVSITAAHYNNNFTPMSFRDMNGGIVYAGETLYVYYR